jgi:hypothetical protein
MAHTSCLNVACTAMIKLLMIVLIAYRNKKLKTLKRDYSKFFCFPPLAFKLGADPCLIINQAH